MLPQFGLGKGVVIIQGMKQSLFSNVPRVFASRAVFDESSNKKRCLYMFDETVHCQGGWGRDGVQKCRWMSTRSLDSKKIDNENSLRTTTKSTIVDALNNNNDNENENHNDNHNTIVGMDDEMAISMSKNKRLQSVIREGVVLLNQNAAFIQKDPRTHKSIIRLKQEAEDDKPDARQQAEQHRIFTVAQECLEEMCMKSSTTTTESSMLTLGGEPILILAVHVRPSAKHADLYWSLPTNILFSDNLTIHQKLVLQSHIHDRIHGSSAVSKWIRRIYTVLSGYYPPKLRLQPATPLMMQQIIHDFEREHN